jgi:hypothetical protein
MIRGGYMRITRLALLVTLMLVLAQPAFACKECADNGTGWWDCQILQRPAWGCVFTEDGCYSPMVYCPGLTTTWVVASVRIDRAPKTPVEAVAGVQATTVVSPTIATACPPGGARTTR